MYAVKHRWSIVSNVVESSNVIIQTAARTISSLVTSRHILEVIRASVHSCASGKVVDVDSRVLTNCQGTNVHIPARKSLLVQHVIVALCDLIIFRSTLNDTTRTSRRVERITIRRRRWQWVRRVSHQRPSLQCREEISHRRLRHKFSKPHYVRRWWVKANDLIQFTYSIDIFSSLFLFVTERRGRSLSAEEVIKKNQKWNYWNSPWSWNINSWGIEDHKKKFILIYSNINSREILKNRKLINSEYIKEVYNLWFFI